MIKFSGGNGETIEDAVIILGAKEQAPTCRRKCIYDQVQEPH